MEQRELHNNDSNRSLVKHRGEMFKNQETAEAWWIIRDFLDSSIGIGIGLYGKKGFDKLLGYTGHMAFSEALTDIRNDAVDDSKKKKSYLVELGERRSEIDFYCVGAYMEQIFLQLKLMENSFYSFLKLL